MGKHAAGRQVASHKKPRSAGKSRANLARRVLQVLGVIFLFLLVMAVIGNLVPQQDARASSPQPVPREALVNGIKALSRPGPPAEGTTIMFTNTTAHDRSGVFTAAQLGIPALAAYSNVWTGSGGQTRGAYVHLAPGTAVLIVVKPE